MCFLVWTENAVVPFPGKAKRCLDFVNYWLRGKFPSSRSSPLQPVLEIHRAVSLDPEPIEHVSFIFCDLQDSQPVKDEPQGKGCRVVTDEFE